MPGEIATLPSPKKAKEPIVAQETILKFLRGLPPFQFLDEAILREVATQTKLHFFPKDTLILRQDDPAAGYLYLIEQGGVKQSLRTEFEAEAVIEVAGEGEMFGLLSSLEDEANRMDVIALTDTLCYAIPRPVVHKLLETQPTFARYLLNFSIQHYLDWSLAEIRQGGVLGELSSWLPLTGSIHNLVRTPLVTCRETATIQEVAQLMSASRVSAVVILDTASQASGIVTDWDLRERVIAAGQDIQQPVREVMSAPLITIAPDEPIYEAIRLMIARNIHHLILAEAGQPIGMITGNDLMAQHSASPLFITRELEHQTDPAGLRRVLDQSQRMLPVLLQQGIRAGQLGWLMADLNDQLVTRVLTLTEAALGPPPVPYCWLVLGSEGRREQTFKTDQDNALIYANPPPQAANLTQAYFLEFGRQAVTGLIEAGFPPCAGQYTAANSQWVQPISGWFEHFRRWVTTWELDETTNFLIFFDFRGIHGDLSLAEQLRQFTFELLAEQPRFLTRLAYISASMPPPVGFLGQLTVEHSGEHRDEFNLKHRGLVPIVDLARFLALRSHLAETNTLSRLEQVNDAADLPAGLARELAQAFEFMLNLRIRHQWQQVQAQQPPSNYINPKHLSALDRNFLREAFKIIARAQAVLREKSRLKVGRLY
jgi:CBS domain-containing protein